MVDEWLAHMSELVCDLIPREIRASSNVPVNDGQLTIDFVAPITANAELNGIRLLPAIATRYLGMVPVPWTIIYNGTNKRQAPSKAGHLTVSELGSKHPRIRTWRE